jgi:hypothetical protein
MPGLLNALAMLDVYGFAERRWLGHLPRLRTESAPEASS